MRWGPQNRGCYRAQSFATAHALAAQLCAAPRSLQHLLSVAAGTDAVDSAVYRRGAAVLAKAGTRRLVVFCPAFVTDCLETLEEIAIRARADFLAAGGGR